MPFPCSRKAVPDTPPSKMKGYQPANCGEPEKEIAELSSREAYRATTGCIDKDPLHNCCTIEADNRVKLWKTSAKPVELEEAEKKIIFVFSENLHLQHPE